MSADEEVIADLQGKLKEYRDQLAQVEEMLREKPGDEAFAKLQKDLRQVVALTEDLVSMKGGEEIAVPPEQKWKETMRCSALWEDGKWYNAKIEAETASGNYLVTYLDYGNQTEVPESSLRPYLPAPEGHLTTGVRVKAIWTEDGLFYDATIDGIVERGVYRVKYSKIKKKKFIVAGYDIVLREGGQAATTKAELMPKTGELAAKFVIPDHLIPKPTDTEATRQRKRKQIKRGKNDHRMKKLEAAGQKRQKTWKDFVNKRVKKSKRKTQKSIFASPDAVDGKVGVINSGKAMTTFTMAGKHNFSHLNDEGED